ncbi:GIY-YIG nuclease family protein [Chlorogloea sp. CCALA 695]|uniref:GIY-YIG nuclease family protein n=1 Tax=Chlorogloea sp. CCALA 695 TaxID=2107693 RepID=UPI000D050C5C|nr:GIY-YIG nuclease family protein [Chlorogloea sp. CCALA 695]PSB31558.1 excinuclease ABC subunit C [Chlorogloea sp. CCALA 695]
MSKITIADLPSVHLLDKNRLPNCAAIYFVTDSNGQIIYIGRTVNLVARWKDHHRFNQLKRFNRKNLLSISWLNCSNDLSTLSKLENEFINLYKPPLNWSKVVQPIRKITPVETALQQSLQQLAKLNTVIFGFDSIAEEKPTIYLNYPVYGKRGLSGSVRVALRNINKKASSLKWKEYHTEPKSFGKFGFWETEYNGIKIDLSPSEGLVNIMQDATRKTIAGVTFMALSVLQLETIIESVPEIKEDSPGLEAVEEDPIPMKFIDKLPASNGNNKSVVEVEPWEELEPMPEGEVREMNRQFLDVDGVEVEVCTNENGKHFVRHNVYWWISQNQKDPERNNLVTNFKRFVDTLPTIRWSGYRFRLETIVFNEDDVEVESILLPLTMFEDLMKNAKSHFAGKLLQEMESGEYKSKPEDGARIKLCAWLQHNSLSSLLQTNKV